MSTITCRSVFNPVHPTSYMCRVMDAVLEGLAWDICMPYLDDIGIFSTGTGETLGERKESSFQQMLHCLDLVLERLIWAGLTCKMTKCTFFSVRAEYLGPKMDTDGPVPTSPPHPPLGQIRATPADPRKI
eukprot:scaffold6354_cov126-Isochrysis_galbana.AAC.10